MTRRAKIVSTIGPACSSSEQIHALVEAGVDVARLNMSHGEHAVHEEVYHRIRAAADATGRGVGILADLQGPKIRIGRFPDGPVRLTLGDDFTITTDDVPGTRREVSTTYQGLPGDVSPGDTVLIDDGRVALKVTSVEGPRVHTTVTVGGMVSDNKGLNLPGVPVSVPALTEKDEQDLRWALRLGVDLVALSFVRTPADADICYQIMEEEGVRVPLIGKIEKPQAVERLPEIVAAFDGIMVARGDLGVEMPLEQVPIVQKRAIELCREKARPVIVATQMLESMISAPRPTRAETSDVANAVLDGTDAVMLSGETSVGTYPVETVATMAKIVETVEEHGLDRIPPLGTKPRTKGGAITKAAVETAELLGAKYLIAFTQSGDSARRMARLRPATPLLAFSPLEATRHQLALSWGVEVFPADYVDHTDEMVKQVDRVLLQLERCKKGDLVVIVAGSPPGIPGSTNAMRVHKIGDAVGKVAPAYS